MTAPSDWPASRSSAANTDWPKALMLDIVWRVVLLLGWPWLLWRMATGKDRCDWPQRRGGISPRPLADRRPLVWVHCVSLGEANLMHRWIDALLAARPDLVIAASATTDTGIRRLRQTVGSRCYVWRYPLDLRACVERALSALRPAAIVLAELEVWPNLVLAASRRGVPVCIANGRISDRAFGRYRLIRPLLRPVMARLAAVAAQDDTIARRFIDLGAHPCRVSVLGTMKFDNAALSDWIAGAETLARTIGWQDLLDAPHADTRVPEAPSAAVASPPPGRDATPDSEAASGTGQSPSHTPGRDLEQVRKAKVWVCGQTGPGEEVMVLDAWQRLRERWPQLRLLIAPRKPERFDEVWRLIGERAGAARAQRRSATGAVDVRADVVLLDTLGELRLAYCLADVTLVGRSLVPMGGSDVMEVAALGKPIITGPYTQNFAEPVRLLRQAQGLVEIAANACHAQAIADRVDDLLSHPQETAEMTARARQVLTDNRGALQRHVDWILKVLPVSRPQQ